MSVSNPSLPYPSLWVVITDVKEADSCGWLGMLTWSQCQKHVLPLAQ